MEALQCVKCDSESRSCASPEIVDCTGKCFTYHSVDRVGGTLVSDLQKGCYPKKDVAISCSCEACDTFQTMIGIFTDGEVDWSCKHHCCDDRDECNRPLHAPTCNAHSVYGFWTMEKLKSLNWIPTFAFIYCSVSPRPLYKVKLLEWIKRGWWIVAGKNKQHTHWRPELQFGWATTSLLYNILTEQVPLSFIFNSKRYCDSPVLLYKKPKKEVLTTFSYLSFRKPEKGTPFGWSHSREYVTLLPLRATSWDNGVFFLLFEHT